MQPDQPQPPERPAAMPASGVSPELLAWAQQTLDTDEVMAEVEKMLATGGYPLASFIDEIKAKACGT